MKAWAKLLAASNSRSFIEIYKYITGNTVCALIHKTIKNLVHMQIHFNVIVVAFYFDYFWMRSLRHQRSRIGRTEIVSVGHNHCCNKVRYHCWTEPNRKNVRCAPIVAFGLPLRKNRSNKSWFAHAQFGFSSWALNSQFMRTFNFFVWHITAFDAIYKII